MFPFDTDFCFVWIKRYDNVKTRNHIFYAPFTGSEARCPPINLLSQDEWYREIFFRNLSRIRMYTRFSWYSLFHGLNESYRQKLECL